MKKVFTIAVFLLFLSASVAYAQYFKIGLSSSAASYLSTHDAQHTAYYFNLGLNAAYEHQFSAKNTLSVGISHFNHSFLAEFPEVQNNETEAYGTTGVWEVPISLVHTFQNNGIYMGLGLSLNTAKTKSIPARIKSFANENNFSVNSSISSTTKENRIYGIAPKFTLGKNLKMFKRDHFFIEMGIAYYSKLPELYIFQKINSEINTFVSPEKALVYSLNFGYRLPVSKK